MNKALIYILVVPVLISSVSYGAETKQLLDWCRIALALAEAPADSRGVLSGRPAQLPINPGSTQPERDYVRRASRISTRHHLSVLRRLTRNTESPTILSLIRMGEKEARKLLGAKPEDYKYYLWLMGLEVETLELKPITFDGRTTFNTFFRVVTMPIEEAGFTEEDLAKLEGSSTLGEAMYRIALAKQGDESPLYPSQKLQVGELELHRMVEVVTSWGLDVEAQELTLAPQQFSNIDGGKLSKKHQRTFYPLHLIGQKTQSEILNLPLSELGLDARVEQKLIEGVGENSIGALTRWDPDQLIELKGVSNGTLELLETKLGLLGLKMGGSSLVQDLDELSRAQILGIEVEQLGFSEPLLARILKLEVGTIGDLYRTSLHDIFLGSSPEEGAALIELAKKLAPIQQRLLELNDTN